MLAWSFRKWLKVTRLQRRVVGRGETLEGVLADFRESFTRGGAKREAALEAYLDTCASDADVSPILLRYGLDRGDLTAIYYRLSLSLGERAALSTIAYPEPLVFYAEATRRE